MIRIIYFTCFLLICTFLAGQEEQTKSSKLGVGLEIYPKITYLNILSTNLVEPKAAINFSTGFSVRYSLSTKNQIRSGLHVFNNSFSARDYTSLMWPSDIDENGQYDPTRSWALNTISIYYLAIPLELRRYLGDRMYLNIGSLYMVPVYNNHSVKAQFANSTTEQNYISQFTKTGINLGFNLKLGLGYVLSSNEWSELFVEPEIQYGLAGIVDSSVSTNLLTHTLKAKPNFTYGIKVGLDF